jgi:mono/diheme cytochrome c family protein
MPVILAVAVLAIAAAVGVAFVIAGNSDESDQKFTNAVGQTVHFTKAEANGRELFGATCASCHTLAAANAVGKVGPNLDQLRPNALIVEATIRSGIQSPLGPMPAGLYTGTEARDVAAFVAAATGGNRPPAAPAAER